MIRLKKLSVNNLEKKRKRTLKENSAQHLFIIGVHDAIALCFQLHVPWTLLLNSQEDSGRKIIVEGSAWPKVAEPEHKANVWPNPDVHFNSVDTEYKSLYKVKLEKSLEIFMYQWILFLYQSEMYFYVILTFINSIQLL